MKQMALFVAEKLSTLGKTVNSTARRTCAEKVKGGRR
jgi:hypothetical protein